MFRRSGRGRLVFLVFLALSILLITLDYRQDLGALDKAREVSSSVVAPIQRGLTAVFRPVGNFFSSIGDLSSLRSENAELKDHVQDLESQMGRARQIEEENQELTELLELKPAWSALPKVTAQWIGTVPSNYKWAIFIDKGSADGIKPDMPVVNHDGLIGKVIRADPHQSVVLLLIDPQAGAGARVQGVRELGVINGNGADRPLSMDLVNKKARVSVGDEVVTSGQEGSIFPPAIPIGRIARVTGDAAGFDHIVEVDPYVEFTQLAYVQVLLQIGPPDKVAATARGRGGDDR